MPDLAATYTSPIVPGAAIDVLGIGGSIALAGAPHLLRMGCPAERVAIVDQGPFDVHTHLAHTRFPRGPIIRAGLSRFGGKLAVWGVSAPRPPRDILARWPYRAADLQQRFADIEAELGVLDPTPKAGLLLEGRIRDSLSCRFPAGEFPQAPLAINRDGRRWCPLDLVPELAERGVRLAPRHRCVRLEKGEGIPLLRSESGEAGAWLATSYEFGNTALAFADLTTPFKTIVAQDPTFDPARLVRTAELSRWRGRIRVRLDPDWPLADFELGRAAVDRALVTQDANAAPVDL